MRERERRIVLCTFLTGETYKVHKSSHVLDNEIMMKDAGLNSTKGEGGSGKDRKFESSILANIERGERAREGKKSCFII